MAIRVGPLPNSGLKSRKIGELKRIFVISPESDLFCKKLKFNDFHKLPFIAYSWQLKMQYLEVADRQGNSHPTSFTAAFYSNSASATIDLVKAGFGVALLPDLLVKKELNEGKLIQIFNEFSGEKRPISYLHPYHTRVPSKIRLLLDLIESNMSKE